MLRRLSHGIKERLHKWVGRKDKNGIEHVTDSGDTKNWFKISMYASKNTSHRNKMNWKIFDLLTNVSKKGNQS